MAPHTDGMTRFFDGTHRQTYPANSVILSGGDVPQSVYCIDSGSVAVVVNDLDDREYVLTYLYAGDIFGESGLFDQKPQPFIRVETRVECTLAEMNCDYFRRLAESSPKLWYELSVRMAARLHTNYNKVHDLAFFDATRRVTSALLDLTLMPDAIDHPDGRQLDITRKELARVSDCSPGTVGSVLRELEDRGLIHVRGRAVVVYGTR
ncbi:cyclic nucleotide-binding domain-containing protein [Granulosicoccus sp. 3-233]